MLAYAVFVSPCQYVPALVYVFCQPPSFSHMTSRAGIPSLHLQYLGLARLLLYHRLHPRTGLLNCLARVFLTLE